MRINLENTTIYFPVEAPDFTEKELEEWLYYNLGIRGSIRLDNPLCDIELSDCSVRYERLKISE